MYTKKKLGLQLHLYSIFFFSFLKTAPLLSMGRIWYCSPVHWNMSCNTRQSLEGGKGVGKTHLLLDNFFNMYVSSFTYPLPVEG